MTEMKDDLLDWTLSQSSNLGFSDVLEIKPLREQASLRNYFRIYTESNSMIGVISKSGSDENKLFEIHSQFLQENGIRVPKVEAFDHQKGFMILEDFGDKVLQLEINSKNKTSFYQKSIMAIHKIQKCKPSQSLSKLSKETLIEQMGLFDEWFFHGLLGLEYSTKEKTTLQNTWEIIANHCFAQDYVLCHFDFEFRNLMLLPDSELGILDFQDLCVGPYSLDLVSIMKDIDNPLDKGDLSEYLEFYLDNLLTEQNKTNLTIKDLERDIDFAGFQRQFRILGTLARLHLRDKKSFRLKDLVQTLRFLCEDSIKYDELRDAAKILKNKVEPKLLKTLEAIN